MSICEALPRSICGLAPTRYAKFRYAHFARYVPLCGTLWTKHTTKNLSSRKLLIKKFSRTGLLHNRKFTVSKFSGGKRWVPEAPCKYAHSLLTEKLIDLSCNKFYVDMFAFGKLDIWPDGHSICGCRRHLATRPLRASGDIA